MLAGTAREEISLSDGGLKQESPIGSAGSLIPRPPGRAGNPELVNCIVAQQSPLALI